MIYQQLLRNAQQQQQPDPALIPREYDEQMMGNSPPLELRRTPSGNVVPRTIAIPHNLHSPQDRATGK